MKRRTFLALTIPFVATACLGYHRGVGTYDPEHDARAELRDDEDTDAWERHREIHRRFLERARERREEARERQRKREARQRRRREARERRRRRRALRVPTVP